MRSWLQLALRSDVTGRGLKAALIVGTILTAINYGAVIANSEITPNVLTKILFNYLVPYCVSTYANVEALSNEQHKVGKLHNSE